MSYKSRRTKVQKVFCDDNDKKSPCVKGIKGQKIIVSYSVIKLLIHQFMDIVFVIPLIIVADVNTFHKNFAFVNLVC